MFKWHLDLTFMRGAGAVLVMAVLLPHPASATIFSSIDRIEASSAFSRANSGVVKYDYHWTIQDWDTTPGTHSSLLPNPCYGLSVCTVAINLAQEGQRGVTFAQANSQCSLTAAEGSTRVRSMGELGDLYKRKCALPMSGILQHTQQNAINNAECIGLFYSTTGDRHAAGGQLLPGSRCVDLAQRASYCEFTYRSLNFNHGTLSPEQISSGRHSISNQVAIGCSVAATAQVFLNPESRISVGPGISSHITTGSRAINAATFRVQRGGFVMVPITSTLSSVGYISGGTFSGSGTLVVTIQ